VKVRKLPVEVDAFRYTGDVDAVIAWKRSFADYDPARCPMSPFAGYCLSIGTLEGEHIASPGDWIIRGVQGEFYPCKPDIFEATCERVEGPATTRGGHAEGL